METKPQENQQELFLEFSPEAKPPDRFPSLRKTQKPILISTHLEQLILAGILTILALCLIFFLGVLRGKSLRPAASLRLPASLPATPRTAAPAVSVSPHALPTQNVAASPAPPVMIVPDPNKPYTIQLVTYKKKEIAENETALLRRQGFFSAIIPSGEYYQVCVGQYADKAEAARDLKTFSARYRDCYLRRR